MPQNAIYFCVQPAVTFTIILQNLLRQSILNQLVLFTCHHMNKSGGFQVLDCNIISIIFKSWGIVAASFLRNTDSEEEKVVMPSSVYLSQNLICTKTKESESGRRNGTIANLIRQPAKIRISLFLKIAKNQNPQYKDLIYDNKMKQVMIILWAPKGNYNYKFI